MGAFSHRDLESRRKVVSAALEQGFSEMVLDDENPELRRLGRFNEIRLIGDRFTFEGREIGQLVRIRGPEDERDVRGLRGKVDHLVVSTEDWKVIPLENLIAHFQGSGTKLMAQVSDFKDAKLFLETMETGVDGLLFCPESPSQLTELRRYLEMQSPIISLTRGEVVSIRQLGLGDRVCVDTCSMLDLGEGMLVGNSSAGLFLMHSESVESGYVEPRPFRVNAGPVHAYILLPDGKTKYLSELKAGSEVLAVNQDGKTRIVVVGRVKVERRPLLLIEAEANGKRFGTIVQNAETIRLVSGEGHKSISELKLGDPVLLHLEEGGRHFGMKIKETIMER